MNPTITPPTYPLRPINGGPLDKAQPKTGLWYYEPKYNGWRTLVHVPTGTMFNRNGERLSIAKEFTLALEELQEIHDPICKLEWLDCEALERRHNLGRGLLLALDLLDEAAQPYSVRRELLEDLFPTAPLDPVWANPAERGVSSPHVYLSPTPPYDGRANPGSIWEELQAINKAWGCQFYEGLVAKRADSLYPFQLRSPAVEFPFWIKHRWAF